MKKKPAGCLCLEQVQYRLKDSNAKVARGFQINFATRKTSMSPPQIVLEKIDKSIRKKLPSLICSHCPFCGRKYEE